MGEDISEYKKLLTELIQKQMVILGPNIALDKARKVSGITLAANGEVISISGDPKLVLKGIAHEYETLAGTIAQAILQGLLEKYPGIQKSS